ncbi:TRAP transporter substrate-binding protein [Mesorhizobium sp. CAU 1741]|uniref:TRAP transporter substrate-binding protein n=1 Tax=Mesorhizobium sp. CAU 1741 TaxID=3140366 RepID=UPI00325B2A1D
MSVRNRAAGLALAAFGSILMGSTAMAADFNMRIHTLVQSPHPYNDMAAFIKEQLEARSDGRIEIRIFDSGQLGQDPAVISEVGLGTIDMMISTTSNAAQQVPEFSIFTMPYLFTDMDNLLERVGPGTPVHEHFETVYEERGIGMKLLALGGSGARSMSTREVAVEEPADLEGLRMRTPPSPMDSETWSAFGMLPVTVAWGELYAAMQTGIADALESSLPGYAGSKLYEVAPNLALTEHVIQVNHTSMSTVSWDKLPEDLQALVQEVAEEANVHGLEKAKEYDAELVESLQSEHDVTVTRPDKEALMAVAEPIQAKLAADLDLVAEFELMRQD